MSAFDILITIGILAWFGIMIYLKVSKKTMKELMLEIKDIIKSMREQNA
jgi:hypothetical protein